MCPQILQANQYLAKAREALAAGDLDRARKLTAMARDIGELAEKLFGK